MIMSSLACVAMWASLVQGTPTPQPAPHYDGPVAPVLAWPNQGTIRPSAFQEYKLTGIVSLCVDPSRLMIRWVHSRYGQNWTAWQEEHTRYWPTAAAVIGDSIVVAGKRRGPAFRTVIERWTLEYPQGMPDPVDDKFHAAIEKELLFDENTVGKRTVRMMEPIHGYAGAEGGVLVHFADSNDLYVLNVEDAALSLLYSHDAVPALANPAWCYLWSAEHQSAGTIYIYEGDVDGMTPNPLVLFDVDKNGTIDRWQEMSPTLWDTTLGDPASWTRIY